MKEIVLLTLYLFTNAILIAQNLQTYVPTQVLTLGVFHFAYPNLDAIKTLPEDKISVYDEPYQSEIIAVAKVFEEFKPTVVAVECTANWQLIYDSLFQLYRAGSFDLKSNEIFQLGFRLANNLNHSEVFCIDDPGHHYSSILEIFNDSLRSAKLESYCFNNLKEIDKVFGFRVNSGKVAGIIDELIALNQPERARVRLAVYLLHPLWYEEVPGDFTGVDFESGRWFNRNIRIFRNILRNIQRIPVTQEDHILLIIGAEHLKLLNYFFEISKEFELVSPIPYLERAGGRN